MGSSTSHETEDWEEMIPESYDSEDLTMEEEIDVGEETKVNIEETTITMEEPAPGTEEKKEISGQTNNQENEEMRNLVKRVRSALQQNAKTLKKGEKVPTILVFYYRSKKKQNQNLPEHKDETPQNSGDEKNDL